MFDDLQNINPFDEGFRRAVEDNSSGFIRDNCFLTTPSSQDTLHTPQILSHFESHPVKNEPNLEIPIQDEPENLSLPTTLEDSNNIDIQSSTTNANDLKISPKVSQPPINLLPKPSIVHAEPDDHRITASTTLQFSNDTSKSNESVKDKLKNIILSNSGLQIDRKRIKIEPVPTIYIGTLPLIASPVNLLVNNNSNKFKIVSNNNDVTTKLSDSGNGSRKRTRAEKSDASNLKVERNRAAARRYRTKMKIQSQALQEKYDKSLREIALMKKEMTDLRKELTQLKTLLLQHKDCPVSKAMTSHSQLEL